MSLTKHQMERLTNLLDERYIALSARVREHVGQLRDDDFPAIAGTVGDVADQALADLLRDSDNAAVGRDVRELREISAARARIEAGDYGTCIDCGGEIGFERLLANPTAVRCVRCQEIYERTHAQPNEPSL
jgi:RNA polymerase-binding protein DksA